MVKEMTEKDKQSGLARQQELSGFGRYVIESVGMYLAGAFAYAHRGQVTGEEFWRGMFIPTGDKQTILSRGDYPAGYVADDPYKELDFQACTKYISYAEKRDMGDKEDSSYFRTVFCSNSWKYRSISADSRLVRNKYMHITRRVLEGLCGLDVWDDAQRLRRLTDPIQRVVPTYEFDGLGTLEGFWDRVSREYRERFGSVPMEREAIGLEVFGVTDTKTPVPLSARP